MRTLLRKRWLLVSGVAVVACGLVAVQLWPWPDRPVSLARCKRVRVGMTLEEVEAVLGGPPGDYRNGKADLDLRVYRTGEAGELRLRHAWWDGDDGTFWVCFDEQDRVVTHKLASRSPFLDKLHAWLGL